MPPYTPSKAFPLRRRRPYNLQLVASESRDQNVEKWPLCPDRYSYSHTNDNGLSDGLGSLLSAPFFPLPNWPKLDWALPQINLNNNLTASVIYDLPLAGAS